MSVSSAALLAAAAIALSPGGGASPVQSLGDTVLPAEPAIVLELASRGQGTFELIQRVVTSARVPFGLEEAPAAAPPAPADLDVVPAGSVRLSGQTVRTALDRLVQSDPRYEWHEAEGRIMVRGASLQGKGVLDLRVQRIELKNASLKDAVSALVRAADPGRKDVPVLSARLIAGVDPAPAEAETVSLATGDGTLLDALTALGRNPRISWAIQYAGSSDLQGMSLALSVAGAGVVAVAPRIHLVDNKPRPVRVYAVPTILTAYGLYSQQAKVQIGVELPAEPSDRGPGGRGSMIDLTGMSAVDAVDRITQLDRRLAWSEAGGVFAVRPRPDLVAETPLDAVVESFVAKEETVDALLLRIASLLGGSVTGRSSGSSARPGFEANMEREALARPLSFALGRTTIRRVLDTLCTTQGTLSWSVQPIAVSSGVLVNVQVGSWDGWSISRSLQLSRW